ncbi:hypothetical protein BBJ28_00005501 [Nothophytophthora sp. Chile5]|nr:hypothetical protein BBJ28_00005501 [Nothophytophthora sp. Chile5]
MHKEAKSEALRLMEPQLRVLLGFLRPDLDEQDHQNATFALLKAILLVQSDDSGARASCSSIYPTFLLEYPLGPKRLERHLKFQVDNFSYTQATCRSSVLDALRALIAKLP